ncbi:hypothetical protein Tco_0144174 [Tanacetum coccineum]
MAPVESPQMVSSVKLLILKKGEYTLWSIRMEQYLTNTDYALWQVIMNGDEPVQTTKDDNGVETEVPPKTAQAILARQKERKAKSILLLSIPDEYQLRFYTIKNAKSLWAAIKKGLDKAYDRFQKLISLLEVHGAAVSNEDENQKFLIALPSSWNNIALIMRSKEESRCIYGNKTLPLAIPLDEIHIDEKLNFIEEPVEIMDSEVKRLKQSRIPIVKVCWNSRRGPEYTWEREDQMQKKYQHLFTNPVSASQATS